MAISEKFPDISCTVLDLQQVVNTVKEEEKILARFIAGDMFEFIPPADAIFLKWILHDWKNEECVKILQQCRKAILCNKNGGKVIIIDQVVGLNKSNENSRKAELRYDMLMMVLSDGAERDEEEWSKIFTQAEFKRY
ncbi:methyltransferase, partial [Mycobacterium tuberculosis]|uniref:methyltransferase n=1 Tax=Mycobacterium tuberculosis TaxID=1773 RepID=UPI00255139FE